LTFIEAIPKDIRPHRDGVRWPKKKVKSTVSKAKGKGKGKAKYAEVDDVLDSQSDDRSEGSSGEASEDEDKDVGELEEDKEEEEEHEEEEHGGREVVKWGPPSSKHRPHVHLHTQKGQPGGSGLSTADKEGLQRKAKDKKVKKKAALEPIAEYEDGGSADADIGKPRRSRHLPVDDIDMAAPEKPEPAEPHPDSPAACKPSPGDRFTYLQKLSTNRDYRELLDMVDREEVSVHSINSNILLTHHVGKF
jgi:hypothetical protein